MSYIEQIKSLKFKISKVTVDVTNFYLRELSEGTSGLRGGERSAAQGAQNDACIPL